MQYKTAAFRFEHFAFIIIGNRRLLIGSNCRVRSEWMAFGWYSRNTENDLSKGLNVIVEQF